ncbi:AAA-peroxin that heterodimerizes with AAA-peroxin Pex1p, partial [Reticulomyxa filosa]
YKILKALLRKFKLDSTVDLQEISKQIPQTFSGADLYAVCSDAMICAVKRLINHLDEMAKKRKIGVDLLLDEIDARDKQAKTKDTTTDVNMLPSLEVILCKDDFDQVIPKIKPSLTLEEIAEYESLHSKRG